MAELRFFYGTMNCGKSTLALQMHHNHTSAGKRVELLTRLDRNGGRISSRIGLSREATVASAELDLFEHVRDLLARGETIDELICDEAQFYTAAQIEQLARVVDDLDVDVYAFGLLVDFTSHLFEGSKRLLELADHREEMQVETLCWCGQRGTHNARTLRGEIVYTGEQFLVGDVDAAPVAYQVLCRRHYREGVVRPAADGSDAPTALAPPDPVLGTR